MLPCLRFGLAMAALHGLQPGAKPPWQRVRLARGRDTGAGSRASRSAGFNTMCVAPSRIGGGPS